MAKTLTVNRIRDVKRNSAGTAQYGAAPTPAISATVVGTVTKTCGLTLTANLIKGVADIKNTSAGKKITATLWGLTPAGSIQLLKTTGTPSTTGAFTKTGQFYPPGSIKMKVAVTTGALSHAKAKTISVNSFTTIRRE